MHYRFIDFDQGGSHYQFPVRQIIQIIFGNEKYLRDYESTWDINLVYSKSLFFSIYVSPTLSWDR